MTLLNLFQILGDEMLNYCSTNTILSLYQINHNFQSCLLNTRHWKMIQFIKNLPDQLVNIDERKVTFQQWFDIETIENIGQKYAFPWTILNFKPHITSCPRWISEIVYSDVQLSAEFLSQNCAKKLELRHVIVEGSFQAPLRNVKYLVLHKQSIVQNLIHHCPYLVDLSINDCPSIEEIPLLPYLKNLTLIRTYPDNLHLTPSLENLTIKICSFSLESFPAFHSLKTLNLSHNVMNSIESLSVVIGRGLSELILEDNDIENLDFLEKCQSTLSLRKLNLANNLIQNLGPCSRFSRLTELMVDNNYILDFSPLLPLEYLTKLSAGLPTEPNNSTPLHEQPVLPSSLRWLQLQNYNFKKSDFLSSLYNLKQLLLLNCELQEMNGVSHLFQLTYLNLTKNWIVDLSPLEQLTELKMVNVSHNVVFDASPLAHLFNCRVHAEHNPIENDEILNFLRQGGNIHGSFFESHSDEVMDVNQDENSSDEDDRESVEPSNDTEEPQLKKAKHDSSVNLENVLEQQDHLDTVTKFLECSECNSLSQINKDTNQRVKGFNVPNKLEWLQDFLLSGKTDDYGLENILTWAIKQPNLPFKKGHDWVQLAFDKKLYYLTEYLLGLNMKPNQPEALFYEALYRYECGIANALYDKKLHVLKRGDLENALSHFCHEFLIQIFVNKNNVPPFSVDELFLESLRQNALYLAEEIMDYAYDELNEDDFELMTQNINLLPQKDINNRQAIYHQFFLYQKKSWEIERLENDWSELVRTSLFAGREAGVTMNFIIQLTMQYEWYEFLVQLVRKFDENDYQEYLNHERELVNKLRLAINSQNVDLYMRMLHVFNALHLRQSLNWDLNIILQIQLANRHDLMTMSVAELRQWIKLLFLPPILNQLPEKQRRQMIMFDPRKEDSVLKNFQEGFKIYLASPIPIDEKKPFIVQFDNVYLNIITKLHATDVKHGYLIFPWLKARALDHMFITRLMKKVLEDRNRIDLAISIAAFLKLILTKHNQTARIEKLEKLIPNGLLPEVNEQFNMYHGQLAEHE